MSITTDEGKWVPVHEGVLSKRNSLYLQAWVIFAFGDLVKMEFWGLVGGGNVGFRWLPRTGHFKW